jgi:hypothetical protein
MFRTYDNHLDLLHDPSPSDGNKETCRGADEQDKSNPIYTPQLRGEGCTLELQFEKQSDQWNANAQEREVNLLMPKVHSI